MIFTTVITSFNRLHCIERAIDSALREMPDHEIVVVDDASSDGTPKHLKKRYAQEIIQEKISLICLNENIGVSGTKNIGYLHSKGQWVIFLDSDDYYEKNVGKLVENELNSFKNHPLIFFRCRTHTGDFVGKHEGKDLLLDLPTYLSHCSFGEALTAVNKSLVGETPPYIQQLRGYEGIGCARLIHKFGPARLSSSVVRIYVTSGNDRLSIKRGFLLRMPLLAKGHFMMIREFSFHMSFKQKLALMTKATLYLVSGYFYRILSKN